MIDFSVEVDIPRPRAEVLAWWTGFPDDYRASDRREQPHRIKVVSRSAEAVELLTWWRLPLLPDLVIPETLRFRPQGDFDIDVRLPFALDQRDRFTFTEKAGSTHVRVEFELRPRGAAGRAMRPIYMAYMRSTFPRTFASAGRLCARDAPHLHP